MRRQKHLSCRHNHHRYNIDYDTGNTNQISNVNVNVNLVPLVEPAMIIELDSWQHHLSKHRTIVTVQSSPSWKLLLLLSLSVMFCTIRCLVMSFHVNHNYNNRFHHKFELVQQPRSSILSFHRNVQLLNYYYDICKYDDDSFYSIILLSLTTRKNIKNNVIILYSSSVNGGVTENNEMEYMKHHEPIPASTSSLYKNITSNSSLLSNNGNNDDNNTSHEINTNVDGEHRSPSPLDSFIEFDESIAHHSTAPKIASTSTLYTNNNVSFRDQIQKCKQSVNILNVIESYGLPQFQRYGPDRATVLCPFHDDHHPSLHIDGGTKQIYKCFACNTGGDVIHFVQEYSKLPMWQSKFINSNDKNNNNGELSFLQALHLINNQFGDGSFRLPQQQQLNQQHSTSLTMDTEMLRKKKERILLANTYAALYYSQCFKESYAGGARNYVRNVRGLSVSTIKAMMIGYAPDVYYDYRFIQSSANINSKSNYGKVLKSDGANYNPSSLVNHLVQSGFTIQEILDSGLAVIVGKKNLTRTAKAISHSNKQQQQQEFDTDLALPITNLTCYNSSIENFTSTTKTSVRGLHSSDLMDRFRDRMIVPIFDETGVNVIGFGGRIITPLVAADPKIEVEAQRSSSSFKAAKYLNSPESLVFEKRKVLFNQHLARKAININNNINIPSSPLIVVEGYMDAISLCEIGIHNVVASMGTAISVEQLDQASKTVGMRCGKKIILCMDNDSAGWNAIERLCRNGMLKDCTTNNGVTIYVARLPLDIKDPSDFVEHRRKLNRSSRQVAEDFREEVIATSVDWIEWYIQYLISIYDKDAPRGTPGSFSNVFERIADFLANSLTLAERTKRAFEVAGQLSTVIAKENNSTEISASVRIQLESDLIDLTSQISMAKDVMRRRVSSSATTADPLDGVAPFVRGLGPSSSVDVDGKLSKNATRTKTIKVKKNIDQSKILLNTQTSQNGNKTMPFTKSPHRPIPSTRTTMRRNREPNFVSVTTHFSGFQFKHQSDMDWLGIKSKKYSKASTNSLVLGQRYQTSSDNPEDRGKHVYFNSAGYNGYQFLTDSAINAGYTAGNNSIKPDASLIEHGLASIVHQDIRSMIVNAENSLLKMLINDESARSVVRSMLAARKAVKYNDDIEWSSPDKQWLFDTLLYRLDGNYKTSNAKLSALRSHLANFPDAPRGAFSPDVDAIVDHQASIISTESSDNTMAFVGAHSHTDTVDVPLAGLNILPPNNNIQNPYVTVGTLDLFFNDIAQTALRTDENDDVGCTRIELSVQETMVSLLWASTAWKSKVIREELMLHTNGEESVPIRTSLRNEQQKLPESAEPSPTGIVSDASLATSLNAHQAELLKKLRDATFNLQALKESSKRIELRLLDESSSAGVEGSISRTLLQDLGSQLDDHVRDIFQNDLCPKPGINDIPYEVELERMAAEWGDWYDDDYVWTPGESAKVESNNLIGESHPVSAESYVETETLEDFFDRIDREWSGWD